MELHFFFCITWVYQLQMVSVMVFTTQKIKFFFFFCITWVYQLQMVSVMVFTMQKINLFCGLEIWDWLPFEITNFSSLTKFKRQIKHWEPIGCSCNHWNLPSARRLFVITLMILIVDLIYFNSLNYKFWDFYFNHEIH